MVARSDPTDFADARCALLAPHLLAARPGCRPRSVDLRAEIDAILYLLRTGCQQRLLPRDLPP